ncbi:sporulation protein YpjB [Cytobacillus gottheilii]|uniref:sporulation protein YpjB n=1 Tax=Cytobacillus gottheilii TaxID=859144 RepID=UPI00082A320E|nr:sporulation protein YpjB [Cytobacillus gottheilii]
MKKLYSLLISILFFILMPFSVYAESSSPVDKLNEISDEALQMMKLKRYDDAKRLLDYFSEQYVYATGNERPFTSEELRAVTSTHHEALQAAVSSEMNYTDRVNSLTKFRLVMDAVTSTYQPMWTEMESPILSVFNDAKEAAESGDTEKFHVSYNSFLNLYHVVYPSMKLNISPERMQNVDTQVQYIDQYRPDIISSGQPNEQLEALEADLQSIFEDMTEDEADPSLWWVIISTGSIIILTLSYVGWRKYNGDKRKQKKQES